MLCLALLMNRANMLLRYPSPFPPESIYDSRCVMSVKEALLFCMSNVHPELKTLFKQGQKKKKPIDLMDHMIIETKKDFLCPIMKSNLCRAFSKGLNY